MIRINLLLPEFRQKEAKQFKLPPFVSPKGLLFFLGALVVLEIAFFGHIKFVAERHFDRLQNDYRSLGTDLKSVREIKRMASSSQEVNRQLVAWMDPSLHWTPFMGDIVNAMEKGVWLTHLQFERREFEIPIKVDVGTPAANTPGAVSAEAKALVSRIQGAGKQSEKEKRVVLVIRGRVAVDQEEAAVIGSFIERLKNQKNIAVIIDDLKLDEIRRTPESDVPMFDFVISGTVNRTREKEFFNLP